MCSPPRASRYARASGIKCIDIGEGGGILVAWRLNRLGRSMRYLTTVVERPANNTDPNCRWFFYKDLDDVPEEYYTRIGARKPARQP